MISEQFSMLLKFSFYINSKTKNQEFIKLLKKAKFSFEQIMAWPRVAWSWYVVLETEDCELGCFDTDNGKMIVCATGYM